MKNICVPRHFSDEEVQEGVALIKRESPDLWERWVDREKRGIGCADIATEIGMLLNKCFNLDTGNLSLFRFRVRVSLRHEAGIADTD